MPYYCYTQHVSTLSVCVVLTPGITSRSKSMVRYISSVAVRATNTVLRFFLVVWN